MMDANRYKRIYGRGIKREIKYWTVRVNTLKISSDELENRFEKKNYEFEKLDWVDGFVIKTNENLSKTIEHSLGYFFLQNPSSMIPPLIINAKEDDVILDLCASPGAKTTQMAVMMGNKGVIVANDIAYNRLKALRGNIQRNGISCAVVTKMEGTGFWKSGLRFDKILLDAPCTGTGTMNPRILKQTSMGGIRKLSRLQKQLLISAEKCLNKNGVIIYSTCSLEPEENEENMDFAVRNLGLHIEKIDMEIPNSMKALTEWEGSKYDDSVANSVRIIPDNIMEGFFICKLRK